MAAVVSPVGRSRGLRATAAALGGALLLFSSAASGQDTVVSETPGVAGGASYPKGQYQALEGLPDWGGIWFVNRRPPGQASSTPVLKGEYLARLEQWKAEVAANDGVIRRTRSNCSPPGMPRIMQIAQYPFEFLFTPGRVTVNQEAWMQTRTIWTDGREHPEEPDPTFMGHSTGHWEGDTLVVDTIAILEELEFFAGSLHSPQFRVTERIRLSDENPDILINQMRMEDPEALAEPFEVTVTYRRDRENTLLEFQCSENDRNPVNEDGTTQFD